MARLLKGHVVNSEGYPMPAGTAAGPSQPVASGDSPTDASPAEVRRAMSDLEHVLQLAAALRPAIENLSDMAHSGALEQGYSEGIARAQSEVQQQLMEAMATLADAQRQRQLVADQHSHALADLAMKIARKVIGEHLKSDPTLVARIVQDTIAGLEPTTTLTARVHPQDLDAVRASLPELTRLMAGKGTIDVVADNSVDQGSCVIVSPVGEVDARIETKLSVLETAFAAQRRQLQEGAGA